MALHAGDFLRSATKRNKQILGLWCQIRSVYGASDAEINALKQFLDRSYK